VGAAEAYAKLFESEDGRAKLRGRTPLSLDRDRILYSDAFRRQDDKYHVLFFGKTRRARNYTSHAVKAAHLARTVAGRLRLNADLSEAIVLGGKVGAVPFLHVGKNVVSKWIDDRLLELDRGAPDRETASKSTQGNSKQRSGAGLQLDFGESEAADGQAPADQLMKPKWLDDLDSALVQKRASEAFPWAMDGRDAPVYSSGAQSYWTLAVNPFLLAPRAPGSETTYTAQTMYGIWRHSLDVRKPSSSFAHTVAVGNRTNNIDESHATYEAMVARYCDDIAWAIENLAEASRVDSADAATAHSSTAYQRLGRFANQDDVQLAQPVLSALLTNDPGKLYTFFVDDLVNTSEARLDAAPIVKNERAIRETVRLSESGATTLSKIIEFLDKDVFSNPAISYRNAAVSEITKTALNILYSTDNGAIQPRIERLARIEGWFDEDIQSSLGKRLSDDVLRIQACVSLLVSMSDRDVFDLVGLE
jgi:dGTP triphosphohydrolase